MVRLSTLLFFTGLLLSALLGLYAARLQSAAQIKRHSASNVALSESNQQTTTAEHHHKHNYDSITTNDVSKQEHSIAVAHESTKSHHDL
jgi:Tfp pilus assembly protein PilN